METFNLKLPEETLKDFKGIAQYEGRTVADCIRRILDLGLREYKLQKTELDKLKAEKGITI